MIKSEKLDTNVRLDDNDMIRCWEMGNVVELKYCSNVNHKATIKMIGGGRYINMSTGEIKEIEAKAKSRADNKSNLYRTFKNARALINTNVVDVNNIKWITLTYAENMTDPKRLYDDFRKFNMRFQYFCKQNNYSKPEYIVMMEPQGRGAWHSHLLYIFPNKAPYIPNNKLQELWRHGFTKTKALDDVDNIGAYLTAYLGDMEIIEEDDKIVGIENMGLGDILNLCAFNGSKDIGEVKEVEVLEGDKKVKKKFVKGARLSLYPPKFNMIRYSRGIKKPIISDISNFDAEKKVKAATLTFEKTIKIFDTESSFNSIINFRQYNLKK